MLNSRAWTPYHHTNVTLAAESSQTIPVQVVKICRFELSRASLTRSASKHTQMPSLSDSTSFPLVSLSQNLIHRGSHVENHSEFHSNQTRLLSNYFWSQPSWPDHRLSILAWEFIGQNSDGWEKAFLFLFFSMCNAPFPAYMTPQRRLHDGSMLVLINT